jgi:hypothetical protein
MNLRSYTTKAAGLHGHAKRLLAQETHRPLPEVERIYESELTRLSERARIADYLMVLTMHNVRDRLRKH